MVSLTEAYVFPNVYYVNDNIRIAQNVDYQSDYFYEITLIGPNIHLFEGNGKYDKITGDMTFNEIEQVLGKDFWTKNDMSFMRSDGSIYYQPDDIGGTLYLNFVPNGDLTYDVSFGSWW